MLACADCWQVCTANDLVSPCRIDLRCQGGAWSCCPALDKTCEKQAHMCTHTGGEECCDVSVFALQERARLPGDPHVLTCMNLIAVCTVVM